MGAISFTTEIPQASQSPFDCLPVIANKRRTREGTALVSAARTAITFSSLLTNHDCSGIIIFFNITAVTGAASLQLYAMNHDPVGGNDRDIINSASSPARVATGLYVYHIHPALQASPTTLNANNLMIAAGLSRSFYIYVQPGTVDSATYSVAYSLIP